MAKFDPNISDDELEAWRNVQDEPADLVAAALLESPYSHVIYPVLGQITKNNDEATIELFNRAHPESANDPEYERLAKILSDYFSDTHLFPQTDEERDAVLRGCEFFDLHVTDGLMALTFRSLIKQYAAARATYVLTSTRLLVDYPHRRMIETLQFVADVMDVNGMQPDGCGIRAIQKLRLIHSMIRHRINRSRNNPMQGDSAVQFAWDESWGHPINQEDMIFAVHTFSVEVIDGLLAFGIKIPKQTIEDYYTTWHIYGRALGMKEELNPTTYAEGKALQERIYINEFKPNPNALLLTPPLFDFAKSLLPFSPSKSHLYALAKRYNDPKDYVPVYEKILQVPITSAHIGWLWWYFAIDHALLTYEWLKRHVFMIGMKDRDRVHYLALRNEKVIQGLVDLEKTWTGKHFRIADGFGESASKLDARAIPSQPSIFERLSDMIRRTF